MTLRTALITMLVLFALTILFRHFGAGIASQEISYSQFMSEVKGGQVMQVEIQGQTIRGQRGNNTRFFAYNPETDNSVLIGTLLDNKVELRGREPSGNSVWAHLLISWSPILLLVGISIYLVRQMQSGMGGRGTLSFGKSRARLLGENRIRVTFKDVAGVEEAKQEVVELVDFLREPGKFQSLGGHIPKGVLLIGPPGTGKTLLARAIAGEAQVPFFTVSGSDFMEMFVGVGASRVRDMFEQAKKQSPCIIFIDEIDAVGRHRGAGLGGGHDEREQTLNQLLVEMDGFERSDGVIIIAATNRPDVLDPALLRPGRFDRQVVVPLPDIRGREQILRVHMAKVSCSERVQPMVIARGTPGFSGADLYNLVNESALIAARDDKKAVDMSDLEQARDKIMMGSERRSLVMSDKEKQLTAYHEAGHAIVGLRQPSHDPVYKVTIIPRGRALGVTMYLPENDKLSYSREYLEARICSLFGGRVAEELIFGSSAVTTGASNDIQHATEMARNMVTRWGLSERLGPLTYSDEEEEVFLGHAITKHKSISDETAHLIDEEVRGVIDTGYKRAKEILTRDIDKLHLMSKSLVQYETLDKRQIDAIMEGREPPPPSGWDEGARLGGARQSGDAAEGAAAAPEQEDKGLKGRPKGHSGPGEEAGIA